MTQSAKTLRPEVANITDRDVPTNRTLYIGRGSKWGNPFRIKGRVTRKVAIRRYYNWIRERRDLLRAIHEGELDGMILKCFCRPRKCHGDVLVYLWDKLRRPFLTEGDDPLEGATAPIDYSDFAYEICVDQCELLHTCPGVESADCAQRLCQ